MSRLLRYQVPVRPSGAIANYQDNSFVVLCSTFRELDFAFREAARRGCNLKGANVSDAMYNQWKLAFNVNRNIMARFDALQVYENDIQYIQDVNRLELWTLAMEFLEVEQEGFPGRKMMAGTETSFIPYPVPTISRTGWSTPIDSVAGAAMRLPLRVVDAAKKGNLQDPRIFQGVHARVVKLDAFLNRTWSVTGPDARPPALATQIDQSWPSSVPQIEPFGINRQPAKAYPGNQKGTITVLNTVGIVSVCSSALALLSIQRSPAEGSWNDADFFSLCQQSLVSASAIMILTSTVFFRSSHVANQAWRSAWVLAILSLGTALVAVPLYGFVSPGWSTGCMAVSSILQMWISVMLMFIVSN